MNILAINSNNFVNRQQIAMNQNHNKIGFTHGMQDGSNYEN